MPLSTSSSVILIPSGATTGNVTISWDFSPLEIKLEERAYKVGSTAVFQQRSIPDTQLSIGSYVQSLTPGDVYEVRAFLRNFNGNGMSDAEKARHMRDEVVVHAFGLATTLETDRNENVGGTFYRYSAGTAPTLTHAIMEIGRDAPVADAAGFFTMANPIMTVKSFTPRTLHRLTTDKLDMLPPEKRRELTEARFALIRVSDASGGWQQIVRPVRTLKRTLTIDFHTIDVQSLGEAPSETEAQMRFQLEAWDYNGQAWGVVRSFVFENHNATLTPFSVRDFVMTPVVVVAPRLVGKEVAGLAVHVQEFDPWPFEDEHASSMVFGTPRVIEVKPGENIEDQPINMVLRAAQEYDPFDTEQEVVIDVHVTVTVAHVP